MKQNIIMTVENIVVQDAIAKLDIVKCVGITDVTIKYAKMDSHLVYATKETYI